VKKLIPELMAHSKLITADEIYEMLFFLEKKNVLSDNLSAFNKKENAEILRRVSIVISHLKGA